MLRRQSTGSATSVGPARQSVASEPLLTKTEAVASCPLVGPRVKAYHFDDDPAPCRNSREPDMDETDRSLLRNDLPARRHSVYDPVRQVNKIESSIPVVSPPPTIVQGFVAPTIDSVGLSLAPSLLVGPSTGRSTSLTHITQAVAPSQSGMSAFYQDFLRRRMTPARHEVVADEVDKELLTESLVPGTQGLRGISDSSGLSAEIRDFLKHKTENEDKEETWTRLTELAAFSLGGFGFFQTRLGSGAYNRERKATVLRQFATEKDALWGAGVRVPVGSRVAHAASALTWGALNTDKPADDYGTLGDCIPFTAEAYDSFAVDGKKYEARGKHPTSIDTFVRDAKQHVELFCLFVGSERKPERVEAIEAFRRLREAHPDVFPCVA